MTGKSKFISHLDLPGDSGQVRVVLLIHIDIVSKLRQNRALVPNLEVTEKYPVQQA